MDAAGLVRKLTRKRHALAMPSLRLYRARPDAPLFIIGSGRSGNTLVRRVLMASGQIYIPPETYVLGDIIESWPSARFLTWRERIWLFCAHFEKHQHWNTFELPNLNEFADEAKAYSRRDLRTLTEGFFLFLARKNGSPATRWGDKTPWNTNHLASLGHLFPHARFLWLVRDGRDVALSYSKSGLIPELSDAARRWSDANAACARFARWSPNVLQMHYEKLASEPESAFRDVFAWAHLDFSEAMLTADAGAMGDVERLSHHAAVTSPISASSVGNWRRGLEPGALNNAPAAFDLWLKRLGYA